MNPRQRKSRRGFSLLELLMVISVSGVLLAINAHWIHQSLQYSSTIKQRQHQHQRLTRLAGELRDDARFSTRLSSPDENMLELELPGGIQVRYVISPSAISVEKRQQETVFFRDSYAISVGCDVRWDRSEMPDWITLVVSRKMIETNEVARTPLANLLPAQRDQPVEIMIRVGTNRWPATLEPLSAATSAKESP